MKRARNECRRGGRRSAFTLIELLVVVTIIGVLVAMLLPAVQSARESARRLKCTNNLKQLGVALQAYHESHGAFPYAAAGGWGHTWHAYILPQVEQQALLKNALLLFREHDLGRLARHNLPP